MRLVFSLVALLVLPSCIAVVKSEKAPVASAAPANSDKPKEGGGPGKDDPAAKRRALESKIAIGEQRLQVAQMELENFKINTAKAAENSQKELALAQSKLDQFQNSDLPNRRAQAELGMQGARDRALEAQEELAQIELMYKEQDLADKTAEFVIGRGRRNAERSKQSIAIQEREFETLIKLSLPRELASMQLEVAKKVDEIEKGRRAAETGLIEKQIGLMNATRELEENRAELAKLPADEPK